MQNWWESLSSILQVLYCIAIPSSLILVLQMILTMAGGHGDGGVDVSDTSGLDLPGGHDIGDFSCDVCGDVHTDFPAHHAGTTDGGNHMDFGTLKLLSLQTIVTFLTAFSWVAIACIGSGFTPLASILIGVAVGLVMMFVVAKIVQMSARLAEDGTMNMKYAIGETASVYLTIPPKGEGQGKVNVQIQGTLGEFDAVNSGSVAIPTGAQVLITDVVGSTLVVEQAAAEA